MEYLYENFKIYVEDDYKGMSKKAAEVFSEQLTANPAGNFGFATGGTPVGMYEELIELNKSGKIDFSGITAFNLDEYYPIKKSSDQSYDYFMKENLFNHVNVNKSKLNIPNGESSEPEAECAGYEKKVKAAGGIYLQILGIGLNGHIGFNEPCDYFPGPTHIVDLTESTIEANARFFASGDQVPRKALTMGIKTIMSAKKILLMVNGEKKADILNKLIFGQITPAVPASVLQFHPDVTIVTEKEAAAKIISSELLRK